MSTYQAELGARGKSWRSVFYQRAKEKALAKTLNLMTPQEQQLAISAAQSASATDPESQAVVSEVANAL
jgi:hypothetical protein